MTLHPRKYWLQKHYKTEIELELSRLLPAPYSLSELIVELRTRSISPPDGLGDQPKIDREFSTCFESAKENDISDRTKMSDRDLGVAGVEAATLYGIGIYEKLQQVDSHVYEAMSRLAGENVKTLSDLHSTLGDFKHDLWGEISKGALNKWKGHLGEVYAGEHLHSAGYAVEWPEYSNQEGFDFLLNGHEVNVKLVADSSSLIQHFEHFPNIPVLVPRDTDLGALSEHAFHFDPSVAMDGQLEQFLSSSETHKVIVDQALAAVSVKEQALDAADIAVGGPSAIEAKIPWITIATATWREGKLLYEDKTDLGSATKNLVSDVAGRGGGAMVGGKLGATVGTCIVPGIGTVVGGIIGSIGGAIAGGLASNKFKRRDLDSAIVSAKAADQVLRDLQVSLDKSSREEFESVRIQCQTQLDQVRDTQQQLIRDSTEDIRNWRNNSLSIPSDNAKFLLDNATSQIDTHLSRMRQTRSKLSFWVRRIWPNITSFALDLAISRLLRSKKKIEEIRRSILTCDKLSVLTIAELCAEEGIMDAVFRNHFFGIEAERLKLEKSLRSTIDRAYQEICQERHRCFETLSGAIERITESIRNQLSPVIADLTEKIDAVQREKGKLGITT